MNRAQTLRFEGLSDPDSMRPAKVLMDGEGRSRSNSGRKGR